MTVSEATSIYTLKEYQSTYGDNLRVIVRKLYSSDDDKYYQVLKAINNRYDWFAVKPLSVIYYLPANIVDKISEIW